MKKILLLILVPFQLCCQQWYSIGLLDTVGTGNGNRGVTNIKVFNNNITIGGFFKREGTTVLNGIAHWNGTDWLSMGIGVWASNSDDSSGNGGGGLAIFKNKFHSVGAFFGAGGSFVNDSAHFGRYITKWDGTDWHPIAGNYPPYSGFNSNCTALQTYHNNLYIGGYFGGSYDQTGVHTTLGIARWNDTVFSAVGQLAGDFLPYHDFPVEDFCIFNDKLIAGGQFTSIDGSPYGTYSGIAAWDDTVWSALGNGFNNTVNSLTVFNGELYAGGIFTASRDNLTPLNHIAKWNGTSWQQVGDGLNDSVLTLTVDSVNNKLYAGGAFTQTGLGAPAKHLAVLNGATWQEVGGGTNRDVYALFSQYGNLYVGGRFTYVQDTIEAHLIAMWGDITNGVNELGVSASLNNLIIVPNPVGNEYLSLTLSTGEGMRGVKIYDVMGECVFKSEGRSQKSKEISVDVSGIAQGLYFVEVRTEKGVLRKKFVKE